jgi:hypothetical protein
MNTNLPLNANSHSMGKNKRENRGTKNFFFLYIQRKSKHEPGVRNGKVYGLSSEHMGAKCRKYTLKMRTASRKFKKSPLLSKKVEIFHGKSVFLRWPLSSDFRLFMN